MGIAFTLNEVPKPSYKRSKPTQKQRGAITPTVRKQLQERSQNVCECCGKGGLALQAAHLTRRWKLPKTTVNDVCHLCIECHQWADSCKDGRKWLEQFGELLKLKDTQ